MLNLLYFVFLMMAGYLPGVTIDVDFQKGFNGQEVSLYVDNCAVFEQRILVSNPVLDFAGKGRVYEGFVVKSDKEKPRSGCFVPFNMVVVLKVVIDDKAFEREFDLSKGSYICVVNAGGAPYYIQRMNPYFYD